MINRKDIILKINDLIEFIEQDQYVDQVKISSNWTVVNLLAIRGSIESIAEEQLANVITNNFISERIDINRPKNN